MLVAMLIFSLVVGAAISLFISGIQGQIKTLATQRLLDQTSYTLEYMSRTLRMALKEGQQGVGQLDCLTQDGLNYEIVNSRLRFINHLENDDCQEFFLDGTRLKQRKAGEELFLTSDNFEIISLQFNLIGELQPPDTNQPKVTFALRIRGKGRAFETVPEFNIQTTISQRNLDVLQ